MATLRQCLVPLHSECFCRVLTERLERGLAAFATTVLGAERGDWITKLARIRLLEEIRPLGDDFWRRPIFIHIPKTAGSAVLRLPGGISCVFGHRPYRYYERRKPSDLPMPTTFTVVRHPYARLLSAYYYLKGGGNNGLDSVWARRHLHEFSDVNDFVRRGLPRLSIRRFMHFRPQWWYLVDASGHPAVKHVLYHERLSEEWPAFAEAAGLPDSLPRVNVSGGGSRVAELTDSSKLTIARLYRRDFEELGYEA